MWTASHCPKVGFLEVVKRDLAGELHGGRYRRQAVEPLGGAVAGTRA
jgi:hypothetical protein